MPAKAAVAVQPQRGAKLTLGFGLVNVPVTLKPLIETQRPIAGKGMCPLHGPTLSQASICSAGEPGEHAVANDEKQIGYPHPDEPDRYVVVEPEVWKSLEESRSGAAVIERLVDAEAIDAAYVDKTYLVWPQAGHEQAFDLLAALLHAEDKAAVVTTVWLKQTQMFAFRFNPELGVVLAHVVHFESRIRHADVELVAKASKERPNVDEKMLDAARGLLVALEGEFDPSESQDLLTEARYAAIRAAAEGKTFEVAKPVVEATPAGDIMAALLASVGGKAKPTAKAAAKPKPKAPAKPRAKRVTA
jgi:Ku protein